MVYCIRLSACQKKIYFGMLRNIATSIKIGWKDVRTFKNFIYDVAASISYQVLLSFLLRPPLSCFETFWLFPAWWLLFNWLSGCDLIGGFCPILNILPLPCFEIFWLFLAWRNLLDWMMRMHISCRTSYVM